MFGFTTGTPAEVLLVFNVSTSATLNYTLFDTALTLDPSRVETFVDGVLMDTRAMSSGAEFDPIKGVAKLGFVGTRRRVVNS